MDHCDGRGSSIGLFILFTAPMRKIYISFSICMLVFTTLQVLLIKQVEVPFWATAYINDFLCMPIVLTTCLFVVHLIKRDRSIRLSLFSILSLTIFYAVYFEVVLPRINPRYTADLIDVLMYFSGSLIFYLLQNKSRLKK